MRCVDCPDMPNGTNKRPVCCRRAGRAQAEADIINSLPKPKPPSARAAALGGTLLASPAAGQFHPYSWSAGERILKGRIVG